MTRFLMNRIAVKQFAILAPTCPSDNISLDTELSFQYSAEAKQIACTVNYSFKHESNLLLVLCTVCEFMIHPDDWVELEKEDGIDIPKSLLEILAVHTIGTSRGILFCKTEGTSFNELMIPPMNVRKMIEAGDSVPEGSFT